MSGASPVYSTSQLVSTVFLPFIGVHSQTLTEPDRVYNQSIQPEHTTREHKPMDPVRGYSHREHKQRASKQIIEIRISGSFI